MWRLPLPVFEAFPSRYVRFRCLCASLRQLGSGVLSAALSAPCLVASKQSTASGKQQAEPAWFGGSGLAMLLVIPAQSIFGAGGSTACWALTSAFAALHPAGFKANYMDIARTSSGVVSGLGNTFASLSSYVGPLLVAWLLRAFPSWLPVFATIASVNLAAATVFASFSTTTPVD
eukprot:6184625-Pleurochrysis_carterae.AAC.1